MKELPDTNPKTVFGVAKPGLSFVPPAALLHCGQAMENGGQKYGPFNWRKHSVSATVYYDAAMRHILSWFEGEQVAEDSGVHHLGHVMACCAILLDAEAHGQLNDDRPEENDVLSRIIKEMTRDIDAPKATTGAETEAEVDSGRYPPTLSELATRVDQFMRAPGIDQVEQENRKAFVRGRLNRLGFSKVVEIEEPYQRLQIWNDIESYFAPAIPDANYRG